MALPMNLPGVIHYSDGDRETTLLGVEIMWTRNELERYPAEFGIFRTRNRIHVELLALFEAADTSSEEGAK